MSAGNRNAPRPAPSGTNRRNRTGPAAAENQGKARRASPLKIRRSFPAGYARRAPRRAKSGAALYHTAVILTAASQRRFGRIIGNGHIERCGAGTRDGVSGIIREVESQRVHLTVPLYRHLAACQRSLCDRRIVLRIEIPASHRENRVYDTEIVLTIRDGIRFAVLIPYNRIFAVGQIIFVIVVVRYLRRVNGELESVAASRYT